jgi:hypothetical protein
MATATRQSGAWWNSWEGVGGEAQKGQAVAASVGTVPGDGGHSRANCEAYHGPASNSGEPIGIARGFGVVFVPQVEADPLRARAPEMTGWSEIMSPAMRSVWSEAMDMRRLEAWTDQIDESRDTDDQDLPDIHWHLGAPEWIWRLGLEPPPGLEHPGTQDPGIDSLPAAGNQRTSAYRRDGTTRMKMARGITVDSGAADPVMPRRMVRGRHNAIKPSAGSKAGVHYVAADNARIKNEGEAAFNFTTAEGNEESWTFQIAAVNKVLCAVSYLVDHRMRVIFDQDEKTGVDTSHIFNKKTGSTTKMKRERNVWTIEAFIDEEDSLSSFVRQG